VRVPVRAVRRGARGIVISSKAVSGEFACDRHFSGSPTTCPPDLTWKSKLGVDGQMQVKVDRFRFVRATSFLSLASLFLCPEIALAQSVDKDPVAIVELGGAAGRSLNNGGTSFGADVAVEVTPIENWLELEAGVTPLFSRHHSTEWDTDLLFKKPWTLSKKAELMAGVGPEWVHTREPGIRPNSIAGEVVLDFMFWPSRKHKFGWFLEPGYDYNFARGHERSFGISGGLLIAIP